MIQRRRHLVLTSRQSQIGEKEGTHDRRESVSAAAGMLVELVVTLIAKESVWKT